MPTHCICATCVATHSKTANIDSLHIFCWRLCAKHYGPRKANECYSSNKKLQRKSTQKHLPLSLWSARTVLMNPRAKSHLNWIVCAYTVRWSTKHSVQQKKHYHVYGFKHINWRWTCCSIIHDSLRVVFFYEYSSFDLL